MRTSTLRQRAITWAFQIGIQVLVFALLLMLLGAHDRFAKVGLLDMIVVCFAVIYALFITGYMFSTLLVRLFLTRWSIWIQATATTVLFFIHFEMLNRFVLPAGVAGPSDRIVIRSTGAGIVLVSTVVCSIGLGKWTKANEAAA